MSLASISRDTNTGGRLYMTCANTFQRSMRQLQCLASHFWQCWPSLRSGSRLGMKPSAPRVCFGGFSPRTRTPAPSNQWRCALTCPRCYVWSLVGSGDISTEKLESLLWGLLRIVKAMASCSCYPALTAELQISSCRPWWLQWWVFWKPSQLVERWRMKSATATMPTKNFWP